MIIHNCGRDLYLRDHSFFQRICTVDVLTCLVTLSQNDILVAMSAIISHPQNVKLKFITGKINKKGVGCGGCSCDYVALYNGNTASPSNLMG